MNSYDTSDFVQMGQNFKVLDVVRFYEIGIPITYAQYISMMLQKLTPRIDTSKSVNLT